PVAMRPLTGAERAAVSCCPTRGGEAIVEDRGGGRDVGQARGQSVADGGDERFTDRGQRLDVDAGGDAFAVEEVDEVVGADVAGRARGEGASAEPAHGRVEGIDPEVEGGDDIGHAEVVGVVEVEVDGPVREGLEHRRGVASHQGGVGVADGVGHPDAVGCGGDEGAEDLDEVVGLGDAVEGADEADGGRDVEAQTLVTGEVRGVHEAVARLGDGGVGVRLRVSFGGREDELDVLGPGVDGPLGALEVEHEGEELDAVGLVRLQATEHLCRIGHLRNLLRVDEGTDLDLPQSCGDELLGQGDLGLGGHDRLLDLETVAQSGVEDVDGVGPDHGTRSHMFPNNGTLLASSRLCEGHFRYTARSSRMTGYVRHVRALGELTAVSPVYREARFFGRYVWIAWPASSSLRSTSSRSTTSLSPAKR